MYILFLIVYAANNVILVLLTIRMEITRYKIVSTLNRAILKNESFI